MTPRLFGLQISSGESAQPTGADSPLPGQSFEEMTPVLNPPIRSSPNSR